MCQDTTEVCNVCSCVPDSEVRKPPPEKLIFPITFTQASDKINSSTNIKLFVENTSTRKTYYYSIGIEGYKDSCWEPIICDINSLGMNEFIKLKPLKPKMKIVKFISKKSIHRLYPQYMNIRFYVMLYEKQDFYADGDIIYLPPISMITNFN